MKIFILVTIFISFSIFYYTLQKGRIRKQQRLERLKEKKEGLLQTLRSNTNNKPE